MPPKGMPKSPKLLEAPKLAKLSESPKPGNSKSPSKGFGNWRLKDAEADLGL